MAMNRVQFQPGLSMPEFYERYGSEAKCRAALQAARWPNGCRDDSLHAYSPTAVNRADRRSPGS